MVEVGRLPRGSGMTRLTRLREPELHVIGIGRALVVLQMARHARCVRDVVIVVDVTIRAQPRRHSMRAGQRETGRGVVELGVEPVVKTVTLLTRRRNPPGDVVGVRRAFVIGRVTAIALRR